MGGKRRRGLADLIGEVGDAPEEREAEAPDRDDAVPVAREEARGNLLGGGGEAAVRTIAREPIREEAVPVSRVPKYLALERKEARLRGDQVDSLSSLVRHVNRRKEGRGGERITENTLIRVAVDWLLSQEEHVGGSSEAEIRRGLGVPGPRDP